MTGRSTRGDLARPRSTTPSAAAGAGRPHEAARERAEPTDDATVLVVEDDADLASLYAEHLSDDHETRIATDGEAALDAVDDEVDVVLLDRRMPGPSGDEVLAAIRDRGLDCRVAMVTAVEPGVDLADVPFDDYVHKPVSGEDLRATVEGLLALDTYSDLQVELSSKRVRHSVILGETSRDERADSEEFARLETEIEALERRLEAIESAHPRYESLFATIR